MEKLTEGVSFLYGIAYRDGVFSMWNSLQRRVILYGIASREGVILYAITSFYIEKLLEGVWNSFNWGAIFM